jgi:hypothetical protein
LALYYSQISETLKFQGNWQKVQKNAILRGVKTLEKPVFTAEEG